jgi:2-oxo-4-hydroxy-4-carboxy-5-ureidoimidazoline decarboxylase
VPAEDALRAFNASPDDEADRLLHACCASSTWVAAVRAGGRTPRPSAARRRRPRLPGADAADVDEALAAHPRIGERAEGASTEAQVVAPGAGLGVRRRRATRERLRERNVAYEQRFDRVFLVRAAGARPRRCSPSSSAGWATTRDRGAGGGRAAGADHPAARRAAAGAVRTLSTHVLDAVTGEPAAGVRVALSAGRTTPGPSSRRRPPTPTGGSASWRTAWPPATTGSSSTPGVLRRDGHDGLLPGGRRRLHRLGGAAPATCRCC